MDDSTDIMVEPLPLLGICNLCLHDGVVQSMLIKHEHDGVSETYVEMLLKSFCIDVSMFKLSYPLWILESTITRNRHICVDLLICKL